MSTGYSSSEERHVAETFRDKWQLFVLLGAVLIVAGVASILVPAISDIAARRVLGGVLIVSGIIQVVQSRKMVNWIGFIWHLLLGILAVGVGQLAAARGRNSSAVREEALSSAA